MTSLHFTNMKFQSCIFDIDIDIIPMFKRRLAQAKLANLSIFVIILQPTLLSKNSCTKA